MSNPTSVSQSEKTISLVANRIDRKSLDYAMLLEMSLGDNHQINPIVLELFIRKMEDFADLYDCTDFITDSKKCRILNG